MDISVWRRYRHGQSSFNKNHSLSGTRSRQELLIGLPETLDYGSLGECPRTTPHGIGNVKGMVHANFL